MWVMVRWVAAFSLVLASSARADEPDVVPPLPSIAPGTAVTIGALGPDDRLYEQASALIGKTCVVADKPLTSSGVYFTGAVDCDGVRFVFSEVALAGARLFDAPATVSSPPTSADPVAVGTRVVLTDVGPLDAYAADKDSYVGKACSIVGSAVKPIEGWYDGQVQCEDGSTVYFRQFRFDLDDEPQSDDEDYGDDAGPSLPSGARVTIDDVGPEDGNYADKDVLVGLACTVADSELPSGLDGYFHGLLVCSDHDSHYFDQVVVHLGGDVAALTDVVRLSGKLRRHKKVRIAEISADDATYAVADLFVGEICWTRKVLATDDGWYEGDLKCDDGDVWTFSQVALTTP